MPDSFEEVTEVGIPPPPDFIYKYRRRRVNTSQEIVDGMGARYWPDHAEYSDGEHTYAVLMKNGQWMLEEVPLQPPGCFVYFKGYKDMPAPKYPQKTHQHPDAVWAANPVKRATIVILRFLASLRPWHSLHRTVQKGLELFIDFSDRSLGPFYLHDVFYTKVGKEIRMFIRTFLSEWGIDYQISDRIGEIAAVEIEADEAYRWRFQDGIGETTKEKLLKNFSKEIGKIAQIILDRDPNPTQMEFKFTSAVKMVRLAWYWPPTRKALKKAIQRTNWENIKMDDADVYHTLLYASYNVKGKTLAERVKEYEAIYGTNDVSKHPPRVISRQAYEKVVQSQK